MTSSYAHVMDRQATIPNRLESPITSNLDNLQAKKNFSVSHLLDLEEAGEMVGTQADESVGETGRNMLESPGLTSGSDTTQQESKWNADEKHVLKGWDEAQNNTFFLIIWNNPQRTVLAPVDIPSYHSSFLGNKSNRRQK